MTIRDIENCLALINQPWLWLLQVYINEREVTCPVGLLPGCSIVLCGVERKVARHGANVYCRLVAFSSILHLCTQQRWTCYSSCFLLLYLVKLTLFDLNYIGAIGWMVLKVNLLMIGNLLLQLYTGLPCTPCLGGFFEYWEHLSCVWLWMWMSVCMKVREFVDCVHGVCE